MNFRQGVGVREKVTVVGDTVVTADTLEPLMTPLGSDLAKSVAWAAQRVFGRELSSATTAFVACHLLVQMNDRQRSRQYRIVGHGSIAERDGG